LGLEIGCFWLVLEVILELMVNLLDLFLLHLVFDYINTKITTISVTSIHDFKIL
jgi:hypothetical protein